MPKLDIFCTVIDNYGDAGVCLHLARTLSQQGYQTRLWCDRLDVLEQIQIKQAAAASSTGAQTVSTGSDQANPHLECCAWTDQLTEYACPDVVINAFNCRLNPVILHSIQAREQSGQPVVVINLEYLSAEGWIEDCHGLASPADGITCYYFFPGFTPRTGGLNVDPHFIQQCRELQCHQLAAPAPSQIADGSTISLFSYHNSALKPLLTAMAQSAAQSSLVLTLQVFTGLALENLNELLGTELKVGDRAYLNPQLELITSTEQAALKIEVWPMVEQSQYDQILLDSCCNLVRGEDSIVRAMHTGRPFLWHIYQQDEDAHIVKLKSFIERMKDSLEQFTALPQANPHFASDFAYLEQCLLAYNSADKWPENFSFSEFMQRTAPLFYHFARYLGEQEPLYVRLDRFIQSKLGLVTTKA